MAGQMSQWLAVGTIGAALAAGCSGDEKTGKPGEPGSGTTIVIEQDPGLIPPGPLSDQVPLPLDRRRLIVHLPEGWESDSRSSVDKSLATIRQNRGSDNSISIYAQHAGEGIQDVTPENQPQFVEQVDKGLDEELGDNKADVLVREVSPFTVRGFVGVHYVRRGLAPKSDGSGKVKMDRLFLETVVAGRKYSVVLRTLFGQTNQYRPQAHAVAAGLVFKGAKTKPQKDPPEKKDAQEKAEQKETDGR